jgi:predicted Zn-dependent protease
MLVVRGLFRRGDNDAGVVAAKAHIVCDVTARYAMRRAGQKLKKRHVEVVTRLPTKRMATACWAFIVAKSTLLETAPMLDFSSLRAPNIENHPHFIHKSLWTAWG